MREEDLIALVFAKNECYFNVKDIEELKKDDKFKLDMVAGTWTYPVDYTTETTKIGEQSMHSRNYANKIIGLYDRMDTKHLSTMVYHARELTDHDNRLDD